jgi:hypothetical protein
MSKVSGPKIIKEFKKKPKSASKAASDMRSKLGSLVREEPSSEEEDYSPPVHLTAADAPLTPLPTINSFDDSQTEAAHLRPTSTEARRQILAATPVSTSIHDTPSAPAPTEEETAITDSAVASSTSTGPWRIGGNNASETDQIPEAVDASDTTDESKADPPVPAQTAVVVDIAMSDTSPPSSPAQDMDTDAPIADHLTDLADLYQSHGIDAYIIWQPIIQAFADIPALQASTMAALDDLEMPETYPTAALTLGADTLQSRMNVAITIPDTKSRLAEMADVIKAAELICHTEQVYVELTRSEAKK